MKIRRLNENYSVPSAKDIVDKYNTFIEDIKPSVMDVYMELAKNKNYEPDQGSRPSKFVSSDELRITECYLNDAGGFLFILSEYNDDGEIVDQYYINIDEEEAAEALLKLTAKKYNL